MRHKILIAMMVMSVFLLMGCGRTDNMDDPKDQMEDGTVQDDPMDGNGPITDGAVQDDTTGTDGNEGVIGDVGDGAGNIVRDVTE